MAEFQIFTGVAVPPMKRGPGFGAGREPKYPFAEMDVGDLLVIENTSSKKFGGTVRAGEKRTGFAFTLRSGPIKGKDADGNEVDVVPEGAVGVWRIASKPARVSKPRTAEQIATSKAKAAATRAKNQQLKKAA